MADNVDRILISYGIDQSSLEGDKQQLLTKIRSIASEAAKASNVSGQAGGETFGKDFSKVSEREIKKGFRDVKDGAVLIFSFLGSFLGATFGDKFGESAKGAFTGALAGLGVGAFFGPLGIAIGAGAGALLGGITGHFDALRKEAKTIDDIATKFNLTTDSVKELFANAKQFGDEDKVGKHLEIWKNLMEEIIQLNPNVLKALQNIGGVSPEAATKLTAAQLREQILFRLGVGEDFTNRNNLLRQVLFKKRDAIEAWKKLHPGIEPGAFDDGTSIMDAIVTPKDYKLTEEMLNKYLVSRAPAERERIIKAIADIFKGDNPMQEFIKQFNDYFVAGFLGPNSTAKQKPFDSILKEVKLSQSELKISKEMREKVLKIDELTLDTEQKITDLIEHRNDLIREADDLAAKKQLTNNDDLDYAIKIGEVSKEINDTIDAQEKERRKNLDEQIKLRKEMAKIQDEIVESEIKQMDIMEQYLDRIAFALKDLSQGPMSEPFRKLWQPFLAPDFNASPESVNNALNREKQWEGSPAFQNDLNNPQTRGWAIRAAQQVEKWEAQARQLNLIGNILEAEARLRLADELRDRINPLNSRDKHPLKQMNDQLIKLNEIQGELLNREQTTGWKIIPAMGN